MTAKAGDPPSNGRQGPDPTPLTTLQLQREVASLKELVFTRLDAMDKAMELFNANITRVPTDTDKQISHLKELVFERFNVELERFSSIATQFAERDVRTEQTAKDSKVAVDAALQAAKEAVGEQNKSSALAIAKSEASTVKQIDQMSLLIQTGNKAIDDKFDDIKDRLTRIEGKGEGGERVEQSHQASSVNMVVMIGVIFAIMFGLAGMVIPFLKHQ